MKPEARSSGGNAVLAEQVGAASPTAQSGSRLRRVIGPGSTLGAYAIGAKLGAGGMAEVYAATRAGPHGFCKRLAIKRILPSAAEDAAFVRMFIDEAALAARLSHPNIVHVFDFGEDDGELFLAMELVEGTSLGRVVRTLAVRGEIVPLNVALYLVAQAARALDYAHRLRGDDGELLGLVHRDVSPGNLLITRTGHLKLADFGIARTRLAEPLTGANDLRGKLGYMSPEQVRGQPLDSKSDVFTLSIIFAELLIGAPLFASGAQLDVLLRIRDADLRALDESERQIPSDVAKLLRKGLRAEPAERPDARQLAEGIEAICARRGSALDASHQMCHVLARYDLAEVDPHSAERSDGAGRFTSLCGEGHWAQSLEPSTAVVAPPDVSLKRTYALQLPDGRPLVGIQFPELVRLAATGEFDARTKVGYGNGAARPAGELPELSRVFSTPALQWSREEVSRPRLRGDLGAASLLPIVHSLAQNRETGVLYLEDGKRRKKVYFVDGRPDFVASTQREEMLGQYLVDHRVCLPMELDMALAVLPQHRGRLGDALVNLGVLRPVQLYRAVAAQVRGRYLEAFRWRRGQFVYVRDRESCEETYPIEQDIHVLMRDACMALHPSELEAALSPLWEKVLRQAKQPQAALSAYQVPDSWRWIITQAQGEQTVGSHFARCTLQSGLDAEDAMRALFLGISFRILEAA
ncbi:MAG TPA: protein kinase [Polyangiales bacterium]